MVTDMELKMPNYKYECSFCDHAFTKLERKISKRKNQYICPSCNTYNLVRLIGRGSTIELKGEGFYDGGIH